MQINIINATKKYTSVTAVKNVSFNVNQGEIVALLGTNGAGKSSIVRMLVGLTKPDSGTIEIIHQDSNFSSVPKAYLGYLPEERGLFLDRTVQDNILYFAKLRGLSNKSITEKLHYWLERFMLSDKLKEEVKSLSKGNQQKVQLITAIFHEPKVLILDEPFSGLDPINQEFLIEVIKEFKNKGMTILLSAHQMNLVERLVDKVILMNSGEIILEGTIADVHAQLQSGKRLIVRFSSNVDTIQLNSLDGIMSYKMISDNEYQLAISEEVSLNCVIDKIMHLGTILEIKSDHFDLHDLYLMAVEKVVKKMENNDE
ncbi:ABC transporter ATP-binding protein [Aliikangiella maris]|uniref:ATP-binding cassette domain-containing protein n=2 Tax=Aliikangiella maris TaxID=3162458 RepID=A0ABV2BYX1_9GAMM